MKTRAGFAFACVLAFVVFVATARAGSDTPPDARTAPWPRAIVDDFGSLPIQDGGRIKPISTYASFTLLRLSGKRSVTTAKGETLDATAWLLDVLLFPEQTAKDPLFLVEDSQVIEACGLAHDEKHKRDRYTYEELMPGMPRLFGLAHDYDAIAEKERTPLQTQVVHLAGNVLAFLRIARHFEFARHDLDLGSSTRLRALFAGRDHAPIHEVLLQTSELNKLHQSDLGAQDTTKHDAEDLWSAAQQLVADSGALALVPPTVPTSKTLAWATPADLLASAMSGDTIDREHVTLIANFETLVRARNDMSAFATALAEVKRHAVGLARARDEYSKVGLERGYYRMQPLTWSLALFVGAFLAAALSWLSNRNRWPYRVAFGATAAGALALVVAIALRCMIRGRPPVSTLYETVLFVTACGTIVALFVEAIGRRRVAVSTAALLGMIGLFVANGYETLDKQDTMPSLVAVLDTNFWLATHVTCITIGYSAGMLAAFFASIYLVTKLFGWKRDDADFHRSLSRTTYGVVCFALVFSLVGTILGGIWANESWGRFWGWDPKENGALMIVLAQVALVHARRAGLLREHGTCMAAAFGGTIIAFSWWGVNLLGVGLHSYGFTSGIQHALWIYYGVQWSIVTGGFVALVRARVRARGVARANAAVIERATDLRTAA